MTVVQLKYLEIWLWNIKKSEGFFLQCSYIFYITYTIKQKKPYRACYIYIIKDKGK